MTIVWGIQRHSPDGSGILFLASLARKRYSVQQEIASEINPEINSG
ncbi:hypothetical protein ACM55G_00900 [Flavobacterium sp. LB3P122]